MRKLILYIANSLDNFIARENNDIDWLLPPEDFGAANFIASVDAVLIGRKTYDVMRQFGQTHYEGKRNIVF
jgi:dihydrofolate reductase